MKNRLQTCPCGHAAPTAPAPRFPDLRNRLTIGWREVLAGLFGPAERLHRYRNLRSAMFDEVSRRLDDCEKE